MGETSNVLTVIKEDNINLKNKLHEYQKKSKIIKRNHPKKMNLFLIIYFIFILIQSMEALILCFFVRWSL